MWRRKEMKEQCTVDLATLTISSSERPAFWHRGEAVRSKVACIEGSKHVRHVRRRDELVLSLFIFFRNVLNPKVALRRRTRARTRFTVQGPGFRVEQAQVGRLLPSGCPGLQINPAVSTGLSNNDGINIARVSINRR